MAPREILIISIMLLLNGVFAAYEMALASISRGRLMALVNEKRRGSRRALYMKERMEGSLAVIQIGITLVGAIAAATGGAGVDLWLTPRLEALFGWPHATSQMVSLVLFVLPLSALTIVFAELIPKMFAIENKETVCLFLSPAMYFLYRVAGPVVGLFERSVKAVVSRLQRLMGAKGSSEDAALHEFNAAVAMARTADLLGAREERIVLSAAQLPLRPVRQIAIPAGEISMIPLGSSFAEALIAAHLDLHTRFPVCETEGDPQTIRGYITFKDIVAALKMGGSSQGLKAIMRPLRNYDAAASVAEVLEGMIRDKVHIALVQTAEGRIEGMVTMEDIIEELVGDIEDEFDGLPAHLHPTGGGFIAGGGAPMGAIEGAVGADVASVEEEKTPLADWVVRRLGRPVAKGESVDAGALRVHVRKVRRRRLAEAFVSLIPGTPGAPAR